MHFNKPQEYWDDLLIAAEDLMCEYGLGMHLVAGYPVPPGAWYTDDSVEPGVMCLFMESTEVLVNPYCHPREGITRSGLIRLRSIYTWSADLIYGVVHRPDINIEILYGDILYEDEAISGIIATAQELITEPLEHYRKALGDQVATLYRQLI